MGRDLCLSYYSRISVGGKGRAKWALGLLKGNQASKHKILPFSLCKYVQIFEIHEFKDFNKTK